MPGSQPDLERGRLAETLIKVAVALGARESKMRWRFQRLENWWRRKRRGAEQRIEQIRGNIAVSVSATHMGSKKPLCTADQLGKLAMIVDSRLP